MPDPKPHVSVACLCEKVLIEPDGVVSLIRIVDTFTMAIPVAMPDGIKPVVELTLFLGFKSGDLEGQFSVGLVLRQPNGKSSPKTEYSIELKGQEQGANLNLRIQLASPEYGLYWFDVTWQDDVLASVPFRLREDPAQSK